MKSAEDRSHGDLAELLNGTKKRRVLGKGEMRSDVVIVGGISRENPAQMGVAEDDDVIEAFPSDRANQPLRMPILPKRARGRRVISDAHGRKPPGDRVAVGRVAVADSQALHSRERHR
jgi:hypothetical protein